MHARAAERKGGREPSFAVHHPVARHDAGERIDVQRIPHRTGRTRTAAQPRDLPVACDLALGDLSHGIVNELNRALQFCQLGQKRV